MLGKGLVEKLSANMDTRFGELKNILMQILAQLQQINEKLTRP